MTMRSASRLRDAEPHLLDFGVAEMDWPPCDVVLEAIHEALATRWLGYTSPDLELDLKKAVWDHLEPQNSCDFDPECVLLLHSTVDALRFFLEVTTRPRDKVVVITPIYPRLLFVPLSMGRDVVEVLWDDAAHRPPLDEVDAALADGAKAVVLCNPCNPTGRVHKTAELVRLDAMAQTYCVHAFVDEVFAPLVGDGEPPLGCAANAGQRMFAVRSATKGWNLSGLRCAQMILPPARSEHLNGTLRSLLPQLTPVGRLAAIGSLAAYRDAPTWPRRMMERVEENRTQLVQAVEGFTGRLTGPAAAATYFQWLTDGGISSCDLSTQLRAAHIKVEPGFNFGKNCSSHVRINLAADASSITRLCEVISELNQVGR